MKHTWQVHGRLKHRWVPGATYFVTFVKIRKLPDFSDPERLTIFNAIMHFHTKRYWLYACVVMNDHVHVVLKPDTGFTLEKIIHSWKSFTTNLLQRRSRRKQEIWLRGYYDIILKTDFSLQRCVRYVAANPFVRWPTLSHYRYGTIDPSLPPGLCARPPHTIITQHSAGPPCPAAHTRVCT